MRLTGDELTIAEPCFYYEDKNALAEWADAAHDYTKDMGNIEEISSSHLRFNTASSDNKTMIMTIPYDKCWKVKCDGRIVDTDRAMGLLMSMDVPGGKHSIEMRYTPRGTVPGLIVSVLGIVFFIAETVNLKRTVE